MPIEMTICGMLYVVYLCLCLDYLLLHELVPYYWLCFVLTRLVLVCFSLLAQIFHEHFPAPTFSLSKNRFRAASCRFGTLLDCAATYQCLVRSLLGRGHGLGEN